MIPIRKTINSIIEKEALDDTVYILLSGGVDSQSVLFSSLELGKKVIVVSFHIVVLPTDMKTISEKILYLSKTFDCRLKTDFECFYPMLFAYEAIEKHSGGKATIVSGLGADTYYLLSKKASIHYKDRPDEYRDLLYFNPNYSQRCKHEQLSKMQLEIKTEDLYAFQKK